MTDDEPDGEAPDLSRCMAEGSCREPLRRKDRGVRSVEAGVSRQPLPALPLILVWCTGFAVSWLKLRLLYLLLPSLRGGVRTRPRDALKGSSPLDMTGAMLE